MREKQKDREKEIDRQTDRERDRQTDKKVLLQRLVPSLPTHSNSTPGASEATESGIRGAVLVAHFTLAGERKIAFHPVVRLLDLPKKDHIPRK